jgi:hypothetical protein
VGVDEQAIDAGAAEPVVGFVQGAECNSKEPAIVCVGPSAAALRDVCTDTARGPPVVRRQGTGHSCSTTARPPATNRRVHRRGNTPSVSRSGWKTYIHDARPPYRARTVEDVTQIRTPTDSHLDPLWRAKRVSCRPPHSEVSPRPRQRPSHSEASSRSVPRPRQRPSHSASSSRASLASRQFK